MIEIQELELRDIIKLDGLRVVALEVLSGYQVGSEFEYAFANEARRVISNGLSREPVFKFLEGKISS